MVAAIRVHKVGGPEVLTYEDIEVGAPGAGQIRVKHRACGVNFIDTYFRTGLYPAPQMPFIPGNEAAGEVAAVGEGVKDFKAGDRVAYVVTHGNYSAERVLPAERAVKLPEAISYEQAAGMMLKGMTARYLLRSVYKVEKGTTLLMHAAAGGVGTIICQWASSLGATVIGTAGSKEKAELAKASGCQHVILYREEDFVARVKEITGGKLCDVVYDGVGKDTFPGSLDCLRPRGMFATFGNASGPVPAFDPLLLQQKGSLFMTRPTLVHYIATREDLLAAANDLFTAVQSGVVKIPVNQKYSLKDAAKAHRDLEGRHTTGSSILIP
ncbi:MAG TPA: quinone oxidoreductase [Xanthobacteraceae bacterium]|nr:quinone oxidoreductase [Xanthobacteraceae bacterium]